MNKIAAYLNEHLLGEVSSASALRKKYSTDSGLLSITPEIIAYPRVTNDIRKIARFTWQLAEKGHVVAITPRGSGADTTSAAVGRGIVVDMSVHLRDVIRIVTKDRLVHAQAGAQVQTVNQTLKWHGLAVFGAPQYELKPLTVGGAIANDIAGESGGIADAVEKLEVVLANGDVIETGRLNKRDVSKKLGLQTFEGELYRKLSALLEDNEEVIKHLAADTTHDNTGYKRIAEIRGRDGSFDLTPLFIGSQGTLGIISEVVLKTDFYSDASTHIVITTSSVQFARDIADRIVELEPSELTIYDGELFRRATKQGAAFGILGGVDQLGAVVYVRLNDFSDRAQNHKLKKLRKLLQKLSVGAVDSTERPEEDFKVVNGIRQTLSLGSSDAHIALPILNGAFVDADRREEFESALAELAARHHIELPIDLNVLNGTYRLYPLLTLESVSDKQKLFKLLSDYAALVDKCGGAFTADGSEGRLKSIAAWSVLDEPQAKLYEQVRAIFDPFGTLNPGVKQKDDVRALVAGLRPTYDNTNAL